MLLPTPRRRSVARGRPTRPRAPPRPAPPRPAPRRQTCSSRLQSVIAMNSAPPARASRTRGLAAMGPVVLASGNSAAPLAPAVAAVDRSSDGDLFGLGTRSGSRASINSCGSGSSSRSGASVDSGGSGQSDASAAACPAMFVEANIQNSSGFSIGHRIEFREPVIVVADADSGMRVFPVTPAEAVGGLEAPEAVEAARRSAAPGAAASGAESQQKKIELLKTAPPGGTALPSTGPRALLRPLYVVIAAFLVLVVVLAVVLWTTVDYPDAPAEPKGLKIVSRTKWRAKPPKEAMPLLQVPISNVVIQHTAGRECYDQDLCIFVVQWIQNFHMETRDDITYNFLVAGDGTVYEGRGWTSVWRQDNALNVALIGNFETRCPSAAQAAALKDIMGFFADLGKVAADYTLMGGCQLKDTKSPGRCFMRQLRTWEHWSNRTTVPDACTE